MVLPKVLFAQIIIERMSVMPRKWNRLTQSHEIRFSWAHTVHLVELLSCTKKWIFGYKMCMQHTLQVICYGIFLQIFGWCSEKVASVSFFLSVFTLYFFSFPNCSIETISPIGQFFWHAHCRLLGKVMDITDHSGALIIFTQCFNIISVLT